MDNNNENIQKNETVSNEIVSFESNSFFNPHIYFDSTLGFMPLNEFK